MNSMVGLAVPILLPIVKVLILNGAKVLSDLPEDELEAKFNYLFGDQFAGALLALQKQLDAALLKIPQEMQTLFLKQGVQEEYRQFEKDIFSLQHSLNVWLNDETSAAARNNFISEYETKNIVPKIGWFHQRLTQKGITAKLVDDIAEICGRDWKKYILWQQHTCVILAQACNIYTAFLRHQLTSSSPEPNNDVEDYLTATENEKPPDRKKKRKGWSGFKSLFHTSDVRESCTPHPPMENLTENPNQEKIPRHIWYEVQMVKRWVKEILMELENGKQKVQSHFLTFKCTDSKHRTCGAPNEKLCCELGCMIYRYLGKTMKQNFTSADGKPVNLATELAQTLRSNYPQFEWAVVISEGKRGQYFSRYVNADMKESIWLQTIGTDSMNIFGKVRKHGRIESTGRLFGQFQCYCFETQAALRWEKGLKVHNKRQRHALVFWMQPKNRQVKSDRSANAAVGPFCEFYEKNLDVFLNECKSKSLKFTTQHSDSPPFIVSSLSFRSMASFLPVESGCTCTRCSSFKPVFVVDQTDWVENYSMDPPPSEGADSFPFYFSEESRKFILVIG